MIQFANLTIPRLASAGLMVALLLALLVPGGARALEVYTTVSANCLTRTGLIVNVTGDTVQLLGVDGRFAEVPRAEVRHVLVFNTLDNPIGALHLVGGLRDLAREVYLEEGGPPTFTGWPIRFLQDVIVFYSLEGTTHVVDVERILAIRRPKDFPESLQVANAKPTTFGLGRNLPECPAPPAGPEEVTQPTRMMSDRIKVVKFLIDYEEGFATLNRFQARAAFYARPYLYEQRTRLGIMLSPLELRQELAQEMPFYFQWSSGKAFDSQGFFTVGSRPVDWLPNVESQLIVQSEVKAHFFSASFVGNPSGLAQGEPLIVESRFASEAFFAKRDAADPLVVMSFNQLALTGLDFGAYSAAGGLYYPVMGIQGNGFFRELTSSGASPIARFIYTGQEFRLRTLGSLIRISSTDPNEEDVQIVFAEEMRVPGLLTAESRGLVDELERYHLRAQFLRAGVDISIGRGLVIGVDEVVIQGTYSEVLRNEGFVLDFRHYVTALRYRQTFGTQASLSAYANYYRRFLTTRAPGETRPRDDWAYWVGVSIEFFL